MWPYIIIFTVAISLTYAGQKIFKSSKYVGIGLFLAAILTLSIFVALRDYSVGTDLITHKTFYFDMASSYDSLDRYLGAFNGGYLFGALSYVVAKTFGSMRLLMFIMTFLPLSVVFYYGVKKKPEHMSLILSVYLLMFFNTSLNVMRQVMAISCIIPAFFLLCDGKKIRSILLILIASAFHISALIMLVIFIIYGFSKRKGQYKYYILSVAAFITLYTIISLGKINQLSIFSDYSGYLKSGLTNLNAPFFILKSVFFGFITYFYKSYKDDEMCRRLYYFAIFDLAFYFLSNFVVYGYRLSYYFVVFYPFLIASIADKVSSKDKTLLYVGVTMLLLLYWIDRNLIIGYDGTIPYILAGGML